MEDQIEDVAYRVTDVVYASPSGGQIVHGDGIRDIFVLDKVLSALARYLSHGMTRKSRSARLSVEPSKPCRLAP